MLHHLPTLMQQWSASVLDSSDCDTESPPTRWTSVVEELRDGLSSMMDIEPADLAMIVHHFDVYANHISRVQNRSSMSCNPPDRLTARWPNPPSALANRPPARPFVEPPLQCTHSYYRK